jgi:O-antigen/teichoic acid export membrane protein
VLQFISVIALTRYLPKESIGLYFLVLAAVHILAVISGLGLDLTQVRILAMNDGKKAAAWGPIAFSRIVATGMFGAALLLWGDIIFPVIDARIADYQLLVAAIFIMTGLRNLFYHTLQGFRLFGHFAWIQSSAALFRLLLLIGLIVTDNATLAGVLVIEMIVPAGAVLAMLPCIPFGRLSMRINNRHQWASLFRFSTPIYLNNILTVIMDRSNVMLMGILLNLQSVAIYEVAGKLSEGFVRIFRAFIVVYFPNLSRLFATVEKKDAEILLNQSLGILSAGISLLVMGIFLFRETIIVLLFSDAYRNAALPLFLMIVNFHLQAMSNILGYSVVSAGYSSVPVRVSSISSIILVGGAVLLIPVFGVIGAIMALFLMNLTSQTLYVYFLIKAKINIRVLDYAKPLLIVALLCGLNFYMDNDGPFFRAGFILLYAGLSWLFVSHWKTLAKGMLEMVLQIKRRISDERSPR